MTTYLFPSTGTCDALVRFSIGGVGQVVTGQEGTRRQRQFQIVESSAWKAGGHTVRFGVDYRRMLPIRRDATAVYSAIADDISSLTDKKNLWLGTSPAIQTETEVTELSLWAQDTWQDFAAGGDHAGTALGIQPVAGGRVDLTFFLDPLTGSFRRPQRPWTLARIAAQFRPADGGRLAGRQERPHRIPRRRRLVLRFQPEHRHRPDQQRSVQHHAVHQRNPRLRVVAVELRLCARSATAAADAVERHHGPGAGRARHALGGLRGVEGAPPDPARSGRSGEYGDGAVRADHQQRASRSTTACRCNTAGG